MLGSGAFITEDAHLVACGDITAIEVQTRREGVAEVLVGHLGQDGRSEVKDRR